MKTIKLTNESGTIDIDYLVDLIGDSERLTVYQVKGINEIETQFGFNFRRDEYSKAEFQQFADENNLKMSIFEANEPVIEYGEYVTFKITTTFLLAATINAPYPPTQMLYEGGNGAVTWSATNLPTGMTISTDGILSGVVTGSDTTATFTVTDFFGETATRSITISVILV